MSRKKAAESGLICENPPWLRQPADAIPARFAVKTRLQELPYGDLTWENYERLCLRVAGTEGDPEYWALYGTKGQAQDGIDIYVRDDKGKSYSVWQSKKHKKVSANTILNAVNAFLGGTWASKASTFYICFQSDIQDTKVQNEIEKQTIALAARGVTFIPVGAVEMSRRLKDHPKIVDEFFGRHWTVEFCGEEAAKNLGPRLDGLAIARLRRELYRQYLSNFSSVDPGIATALHSRQYNQLPLVSRFVEPDITADELPGTVRERQPSPPDDSDGREVAPGAIPKSTAPTSSMRAPVTVVVRRALANWLTEVEQAAIVAPAGYGKSSFLRALALDLLSEGALFPDLVRRWGDRIPIVLPFASWTRLIAGGAEQMSLADAIRFWFKRFQLSEELLELIVSILKDNRLLLLIDGLDEWTNREAARSALTLLDTFVKSHSINAVVTTRPGGVTKLGALDPLWTIGNLAPLTDYQQRRLATIWFSYLRGLPDGGRDTQTSESNVRRDVDEFFSDLGGRGMLMPLAGIPLLLSGLISLAVRSVVLPRNRFQAYSQLVDLLLDEHPKRRAAASLPIAARSSVLADSALVRRALSALAFHNRLSNLGASTPYTDARAVVVEYLQSMDGAGLTPADAILAANDLLTLDAETTGLLVQKTPDEIGFLHAIFEEFLAGSFASTLEVERQKVLIAEHIGDQKWMNVLLAMLHSIVRAPEVEALVRVALSAPHDQSHAKLSRQLAAEVIFGEFRCPPKYALEIAAEIFETIERGSWPQERENLLSLVFDAGAAGPLTEPLRHKLAAWMPNAIPFRTNVYPRWPTGSLVPT